MLGGGGGGAAFIFEIFVSLSDFYCFLCFSMVFLLNAQIPLLFVFLDGNGAQNTTAKFTRQYITYVHTYGYAHNLFRVVRC